MKSGGRQIYILCEGETEENAVNHFLRKQWNDVDGMKSVGLKSKITRPKKIAKDTKLAIENDGFEAVFTMYDLHKFPCKSIKGEDYKDRLENLREKIKTMVGFENKFFPHFSIHEIEAWLLAEGKAVAKRLRCNFKGEANAEEKNFENPPKERLNDLFLRHKKTRYRENIDSASLFKEADFSKVYKTCPYFRQFYDELLEVGKKINTQ